MKKVVLLVLPVIFLLIGFDYGMAEVAKVSPELAAARAKYDTPFIKKYRPRYEANNINLFTIFSSAQNECLERCSEKDLIAIKSLANIGDSFAMSMLPTASAKTAVESSFNLNDLIKQGADNGSAILQYVFALSFVMDKNPNTGTKYAKLSKEQGYFNGYITLSNIYARNKNFKDFCTLLNEGYSKFGIEILSNYLIDALYNDKSIFLKCVETPPHTIVDNAGEEGQLIKGHALLRQKKYNEAYKLFSGLYKQGDGSKISSNAGYCLGMMNYYGKGVDKNIEKGRQLLKEAFDNGVYYNTTPHQEKYILPNKFELISYNSEDECSEIN